MEIDLNWTLMMPWPGPQKIRLMLIKNKLELMEMQSSVLMVEFCIKMLDDVYSNYEIAIPKYICNILE